MNDDRRNYGIDLLKVFMMFLIVCGHVIWHGNIWSKTVSYNQFVVTGEIVRIIDIISSCVVNCYAMTTGYLLFDSSCNKKKILAHWRQVETYSVLCFFFIGTSIDFSVKNMISSFFPIARNQYWYFTSYFIVYLLAPYINKMLKNLNKKEFSILVFGEIIFLSVVPTLVTTDVFSLNRGYSPWWMIVLYTIGAYIKRFKTELSLNIRYIIMFLIILLVLSYVMEKIGELMCTSFLAEQLNIRDIVVGYTKTLTVFESLATFLIFENIIISSNVLKKWISIIAKATFGVYLFHDNIYIRQAYSNMLDSFFWGGVGSAALLAISLFMLGVVIELLRTYIVKKMNSICTKQ